MINGYVNLPQSVREAFMALSPEKNNYAVNGVYYDVLECIETGKIIPFSVNIPDYNYEVTGYFTSAYNSQVGKIRLSSILSLDITIINTAMFAIIDIDKTTPDEFTMRFVPLAVLE